MTDRESELRAFAARLREREVVADAFLAKSFTDRILVVDAEGDLPASVRERLDARDFRAAGEVYGAAADGARSFVGDVDDGTRHHFVDVRTRGDHQSYVVE